MTSQRAELASQLPSERIVRVFVPMEVSFNLDRMQKVTANLLGRLGCPSCHSGVDIRFMHLRDFIVDAKSLDVQSFASREL